MATKAATKKVPAKKAVKKPATKTAIKRYVPPGKLAKKAAPEKPKAPQSDKPIDPTRLTQNGVTQPAPRSVAGELWAIADKLKATLGRNPARFEFRKAVEDGNAERVKNGQLALVANSVSFQYFKWRTFNGIKGREVGLYPKRNSFELSVPVVRTPRTPKTPAKTPEPEPAKTPAKTPEPEPAKTPAKTPEPEPAKTPAKTPEPEPAKTPAKTPEPEPAKTPAKTPEPEPAKTPAKTPEPEPAKTPAKTPEPEPAKPAAKKTIPAKKAAKKVAQPAPGVSSRLASVSAEAAAATDAPDPAAGSRIELIRRIAKNNVA